MGILQNHILKHKNIPPTVTKQQLDFGNWVRPRTFNPPPPYMKMLQDHEDSTKAYSNGKLMSPGEIVRHWWRALDFNLSQTMSDLKVIFI